ncbi:NAD-dependent succinate-semialdehyde dehydrogenase [Rhodococcus sp. IEGM1428]|uniref:NAD-dependent succinate-semialdehyde dehydrogenase n=1 Tax=Rhodococcus sp. IEGM1428 TaxID=3392191 RepID=UPI003D0A793A
MSTKNESTLDILRGVPTGVFINGGWRDAETNATFQVHDPATGQTIADVADATPADGLEALDASVAAQKGWAATAPRDRAELLRAAFDAVIARTDDFAALMTLEMGKPLAEARGEVAYGAEFLRWFSEETVRISGRYATAPDGKTRLLVHKRPVGPCLFITPWNFPLAMATRKIAPAIAAGCTMTIKPAKLTPLTTLLLAHVLDEVGLPPGVLNVLPTSNAEAVTGPLIADPRLRKLSFTGSTDIGKRLLADSAQSVLRTSMELGGNAPFVVFADADVDAAVAGAMTAKMRNMGEACTAANRFIVHRSLATEFATKLADTMAKLTLGPGNETGVEVGPLIDQQSRDKVHELVEDARRAGATVLTGGHQLDRDGYFYAPTVLFDVPEDARILREEVFGPVAPVITFEDEAEAIRLANDTEYGLVAYVFTRDTARTLRLSEELETGMLGINVGVVSNPAAPFGGVKQSGLGREGGIEGIEEYLDTRYVGISDPYS